MITRNKPADFKTHYRKLLNQNLRNNLFYGAGTMLFFGLIGYNSKPVPVLGLGLICVFLLFLLQRNYSGNYRQKLALLDEPFPADWQAFLEESSLFYQNLSDADKAIFNKRVQFFLAEKNIEGISTEIDDHLRLLVAASAIIPTFAFPFFEYPNLKQVLIYPNSFNRRFETEKAESQEDKTISGMVGNGFMNGTLLLSKTDLVNGFKGKNPNNVGIHEFVHLLDMADGAVDGMPEIFLNNAYTLPWLKIIQEEVRKIKTRKSDINPYGLTNNAEFLAVASEYFFDNPEKFMEKHPELYDYLCAIFQQRPDRPSLRWIGKLKPAIKPASSEAPKSGS